MLCVVVVGLFVVSVVSWFLLRVRCCLLLLCRVLCVVCSLLRVCCLACFVMLGVCCSIV